jgi:predicted ribosome quality control (RQC) complex YloA/Tae2 family protein
MVKIDTVRPNNMPCAIEYRIGKYAAENTSLIQKSLPDDIWFHLENESSAHVVVSMPTNLTKKQKSTVIKWGGAFCKKYSHKTQTCSVVYAPIKNLTPTEVPGAVHIHGTYKTIFV